MGFFKASWCPHAQNILGLDTCSFMLTLEANVSDVASGRVLTLQLFDCVFVMQPWTNAVVNLLA